MAITVDGAFDAVISYSGGANVYTFDATLGGVAGDIAVVAVSCHNSLPSFGAASGWNFLGAARPDPATGAQVALYWKLKTSGDTSYVFQSGTSPAQDVNAAGQLLFVRGASSSSMVPVSGFNSGDYLDEIDEMEAFISPATLTTVNVADGSALLAFVFSNFNTFNVRQYANMPLVGTYNSTTDMTVLSPTSAGAQSGFAVASGASSVPVVVQVSRFDSAAAGKFEQFQATWVALTIARKKKTGLFGVNH